LQFTGKERDQETGLDYFGERYYSGALGRFTTTDPQQASASLFEPQSWNLYSYVWNRPMSYKDPDGRNPLLVTAAVGAGVGALVGGGFEVASQLLQNGGSLDNLHWSKVGTAALGGGIAGGITGGTLGLGSALGISYTALQTAGINAAGNIIGSEVQRQADVALGNSPAPTTGQEVVNLAVDGAAGIIGGTHGGGIADKIYPLPNVKKEIAVLQFAHRRSTRALQIQAAKTAANIQAANNAFLSGTVGGLEASVSSWWSQTIWNGISSWWRQWWLNNPAGGNSQGCVSVSDSASGSQFGGCQ